MDVNNREGIKWMEAHKIIGVEYGTWNSLALLRITESQFFVLEFEMLQRAEAQKNSKQPAMVV